MRRWLLAVLLLLALASPARAQFNNSCTYFGDSAGICNPAGAASFVGALDGLPAPAAAYSVRRLLTAYLGKAMNVCLVATPASCQDIGFTALGDLDSAAFTSFCSAVANSCAVNTWYDQSGNGNDCSQATSASRAPVNLSIFNGEPAIGFNSGLTCVTPSSAVLALAGDQTLLVVAAQNGQVGSYVNANFSWQYGVGAVNGNTPYYNASTGGNLGDAGQSVGGNTQHFMGATRLSGTAQHYVDNVAGSNGTGFSNAASAVPMTIGGITSSESEFYIWASGLSGANLTTLHTNVAAYFGTP